MCIQNTVVRAENCISACNIDPSMTGGARTRSLASRTPRTSSAHASPAAKRGSRCAAPPLERRAPRQRPGKNWPRAGHSTWCPIGLSRVALPPPSRINAVQHARHTQHDPRGAARPAARLLLSRAIAPATSASSERPLRGPTATESFVLQEFTIFPRFAEPLPVPLSTFPRASPLLARGKTCRAWKLKS